MGDETPEQRLARIERKIDRLYAEFTAVVSIAAGLAAGLLVERSHVPFKDWLVVAAIFIVTLAVGASFERNWP